LKLEKRSSDACQVPKAAENGCARKGRSHVLIYILILFIAAFFLMTLSFLSHQRSNEQVLGQLHANATNLEKLQSALEQNVRLQEQVDAQKRQMEDLKKELAASEGAQTQLKEKISALDKSLTELENAWEALQKTSSAVDALTQLQQLLIAGDTASCRKIIADMETTGLDKFLPAAASSPGGISPQQMFQQAKLLAAAPAE